VRGMVDHAARSDLPGDSDRNVVGRAPAARLETAPSGGVSVRGPDAYRSQATVLAEGAGFRAVADAPAVAPGFYVFEAGGHEAATVAVNPDPIESDLTPLPVDSLRAGSEPPKAILTTASLRTYLHDTRQGRELWLPFLVLAALCLAAELWVGTARIAAS
jgi:hypothetical protein